MVLKLLVALLVLSGTVAAQQIPTPGQEPMAASIPVVIASDQTSIPVAATTAAPTTIVNGLTNVTTAGTRVTLAATTTVKGVTIKARSTNTGTIYVGNTTVSSANGFQLKAGESISMAIADLATVNLDSSVNGEGVTYAGVN